MAKWEIIEDIKFKKQAGGKTLPKAQNGLLTKIKSTLNPLNIGVPDYTDKYKTWNEAYSAAKKAGLSEIMWNKGPNPGRKNLDYAGTPAQEMKSYGITGEQRVFNPSTVRKNLGRLDTEEGYDTELSEVFKQLFDSKNPAVVNNEEPAFGIEKDAFRLYLGLPQEMNSFTPSKYQKGAFEIVNYNQMLPEVLDENIENLIKTKGNPEKEFKYGEHIEGGNSPIKPYGDIVMGKHTVKKGKDDKGEYIEYADKWDLDSYKVGNVAVGQIADMVNKPFPIYGRVYYKDYGDGVKRKMYYTDNELKSFSTDKNNKNFNALDLQKELVNRGYELPNSMQQDDYGNLNFDGIYGNETKQALQDFQSNSTPAPKMAVSLPGQSTALPPELKNGGKVSGWQIIDDVPKAEKGLAVGERKILQRPTQPVQEKSVIKSIPTTVKPQYKSEGDYLNQVYGEDSGVQLPGQSSILRASQDSKPFYDVAKQDYSSYKKDFSNQIEEEQQQKTDEQKSKVDIVNIQKKLNDLKKEQDSMSSLNGGLGSSNFFDMLKQRDRAQEMGVLESKYQDQLQNTPLIDKADAVGTIMLTAGKYYTPPPLRKAIDYGLNIQDVGEFYNQPKDTLNQASVASDVLSYLKIKKTDKNPFSYIGDAITLKQKLDLFNNASKQTYKHGGIIEDPRGQWAHPGSVTRIPSNQITMQGVNYPVLGVSDRGHTQMMYPGEDYSFRGKSVTEYPMMAGGGQTLLRNQILNTRLPATNRPTLNPNFNRSTSTTSPLSLQALGKKDYGISLNRNGLNLSAGLNLEGKNPAFRAGVDYGKGNWSGSANYSTDNNNFGTQVGYNNKGFNAGAGYQRNNNDNSFNTNAGYSNNGFNVGAGYQRNNNNNSFNANVGYDGDSPVNFNANYAYDKDHSFDTNVGLNLGKFSGGLNYGYNQEGDKAHNFGANANLDLGKNLNLSADANFDSNKNYQVNAGLKYNFQDGGEVNFTYAGENHRVYEKVSPTGNGKGIEGHIMVNHPTENKKRWDTIDLTKITNGRVKTVAQGVASTKKWHKENPEYANGGQVVSEIWEETTGLPWSEAKKLGLTKGGYEENLKLRSELLKNPDKFTSIAKNNIPAETRTPTTNTNVTAYAPIEPMPNTLRSVEPVSNTLKPAEPVLNNTNVPKPIINNTNSTEQVTTNPVTIEPVVNKPVQTESTPSTVKPNKFLQKTPNTQQSNTSPTTENNEKTETILPNTKNKEISAEEYQNQIRQNYKTYLEKNNYVSKTYQGGGVNTENMNCIHGVCDLISGTTDVEWDSPTKTYTGNETFSDNKSKEGFYVVNDVENSGYKIGDILQFSRYKDSKKSRFPGKITSKNKKDLYPNHAEVILDVEKDENGETWYTIANNKGSDHWNKLENSKISEKELFSKTKRGDGDFDGIIVNRYNPEFVKKQKEEKDKDLQILSGNNEYASLYENVDKTFSFTTPQYDFNNKKVTEKPIKQTKDLLKIYEKNYSKIGKSSNLSPEILDEIIKNQLGIAQQETKFGTSLKMSVKENIPDFAVPALKSLSSSGDDWVEKYWQDDAFNVQSEYKTKEDFVANLQKKNSLDQKTREWIANNSPRSKGIFQQKDLSKRGRYFDLNLNKKEDQVLASLNLAIDNYHLLAKKSPNLGPDELLKLSTLMHNAPRKALTNEFVNYFLPNNNIDYVNKVDNFLKQGIFKAETSPKKNHLGKLKNEDVAGLKKMLKVSKNGGMIKRADGSYSQRGLWDNIRDNADGGQVSSWEIIEDLPKAGNGLISEITSTLNPKNWGVTNYSDKGSFDSAYSTAKKAGEQEFMFNNKRYNTKYAGTPRQEVGRYGVNGQQINPEIIDQPAKTTLFPSFYNSTAITGRYLPGHIGASVSDGKYITPTVNYSSMGNEVRGVQDAFRKDEKTYYSYGVDPVKFTDKAKSLPLTEKAAKFMQEKSTPSDWNLFTNNCADNVCDAFGIPRNKGLQTPSDAIDKIKEKYPTQDVTGRTYGNYVKLYEGLQNQPNEKILSQANNILGIASSPEIQKSGLSNKLISTIQGVLAEEGYDLSKSLKQKGNYDGVLGDETKKALQDYQSKKTSAPKMAVSLPGQLVALPPKFKIGGKTKKLSWEIIEDSDELDEYKNGGKTSAWQRKEGKSPSGGLNDKGRASLKKEGHDIKPPQPEGGSRKDSFCARMSGMKKKLTGSKKANDPNSRINLSLKKWKC